MENCKITKLRSKKTKKKSWNVLFTLQQCKLSKLHVQGTNQESLQHFLQLMLNQQLDLRSNLHIKEKKIKLCLTKLIFEENPLIMETEKTEQEKEKVMKPLRAPRKKAEQKAKMT